MLGYLQTTEVLAMRIGTSEMVLLVVLALLIFGGSRISGLGKALGTSIRDFKAETADINKTEVKSEKVEKEGESNA